MRTRLIVLLAAVAVSGMPRMALAQTATAPRATAASPVVAPAPPPSAALAPTVPVPQPPAPPQAAAPQAAPPTPQAPRAPTAPRVLQPSMEFSGTNVRVDVTLTDQGSDSAPMKKSISLTIAEHSRGSVRSGVTIPVPSTTFTPGQGEGPAKSQPVTSFQYRDVGLSLDVQDVSVQGSLIRLRVAVEYNPVDEKTASQEGLTPAPTSAPPSFARFSQSLTLTLEDGKPLMVAQSSDPVPGRNRTASLEVKATIVKAGAGK